jgi:hypothetical protein
MWCDSFSTTIRRPLAASTSAGIASRAVASSTGDEPAGAAVFPVHLVEGDEHLLLLPGEGLREPELVEDERVLALQRAVLGRVERGEVPPGAHVQVDGDAGVDGRRGNLEQRDEEHGHAGYVRAGAPLFGRLRRKDRR